MSRSRAHARDVCQFAAGATCAPQSPFAGRGRTSNVHVETEVDVAGSLSAPDSPVLRLALPERDADVVSWDTECLEPVDDLGVEVPLGLNRAAGETVDRHKREQL